MVTTEHQKFDSGLPSVRTTDLGGSLGAGFAMSGYLASDKKVYGLQDGELIPSTRHPKFPEDSLSDPPPPPLALFLA
ncbi:uncharacterized protein PHALS_11218 [Plasmopara halstedii]|uniref:Uncharacterized protein n=1 Tax=Plasmopara halstedii TaxID=4781 RepID=A0A0P1AJJ9_PLAHL|nr:uncharacterized protein PHALS_11218 [Plasmopara halstedii]CEG41049.1 hypothetical protein PHALS_11218 [Plasmopara halstedii]|eukprot:XP_024577418.1 hypothetical protein PHALS_11218 [Plasmopara halstedii]